MSRFPPLLQKLHEAPSATDSGRSGVFRGDVRSANWDGGGDLSSGKDTTATAGYLLDYSSGSIQVQSIFAEGGSIGALSVTGELTVGSWLTLSTSGGLRTASSGQRIELTNSSANIMRFYSGDADETGIGQITETTNGSGDTRTVQFGVYSPQLEQVTASQVDATGSFVVRSGSPDGTSYAPGFVFARLSASTGGGQDLQVRIQNAIPLITDGDVTLMAGDLSLTAGDLTVTAGGLTVTAGIIGLTGKGTAAAPAIGIGSNFDDGLYSPQDGELSVTTSGVQRVNIYATRAEFKNMSFLGMPVKSTTGDPSSPQNGDMYVNTFDNKVRVYADAAWRDLATW